MHIPADESALADLAKLDNELRARGLQARLVTPAGRLPYLAVHEPDAPASAERVYAQADSYFWPCAERIAACDDVTSAVATIARTLRAGTDATDA